MNTTETTPGGWVTPSEIEATLTAALSPTAMTLRNDSHLHAGHAGAREGSHYHLHIRSAHFTGLSRVARHRLVYSAVASLMPRGIHALAIEALAPEEP